MYNCSLFNDIHFKPTYILSFIYPIPAIPMRRVANHPPLSLSAVSCKLPIGIFSTSQGHANKHLSIATPPSAFSLMNRFQAFHRILLLSFSFSFPFLNDQLSSLSSSEAFQTSVSRCISDKNTPNTAVFSQPIDETRVLEGVLSVGTVETVECRWRKIANTPQ